MYTSPELVVRAPRPPAHPPDCNDKLAELDHVIGQPVIDAQCDDLDPDDDYWYCVYAARNELWDAIQNAAYWAVLFCDDD